jgi:lantibiotic biosynthesis protein
MSGSSERDALLAVADRLAREIVADAVWHGGRCNWVGAMPEELPGGQTRQTFRALGADLYGGSAGVGLFLAEVARATGDSECRRTAVGAFRHAVSRVNDLPPATRLGLYAGAPGVALALALAAHTLADPELEAAARTVAELASRLPPAQEFDLMVGSAGAVVGLLALRSLLGDESLVEHAAGHGEALLASGQPTQAGGLSWPSASLPGAPALTGFSHGAAGIAVALLELERATEDRRYGEAAQAAFTYERSVYDPGAGNWPDLRHAADPLAGDGPTFATFWCHGAPGGALARLRALELGYNGELAAEARAALRTTEAWVANAVASGVVNYSLCHGIAGNAEVLLEGAELEGSVAEGAHRAATAGIESYHARSVPWPSGAYGGATPDLFLGLAGIGRFYLRIANPELPSLLLVRPDQVPAPVIQRPAPTGGVPG